MPHEHTNANDSQNNARPGGRPHRATLHRALHRTLTARLGSATAAAIRLRAVEQFARDRLPCRLAVAALCCAEGVAWIETQLDRDPAAFEEELAALMDRPDFWRDQEPAAVRRVRNGYARLYPGP